MKYSKVRLFYFGNFISLFIGVYAGHSISNGKEESNSITKQQSHHIAAIGSNPNSNAIHDTKISYITKSITPISTNSICYENKQDINDPQSLSNLISETERQLAKDPQNVKIASGLIDAMEYAEQSDRAIEIAHNSLTLDQSNPFLNYRLGMLYMQNGDANTASVYFNNASSLSDEYRELIAKSNYEGQKSDSL